MTDHRPLLRRPRSAFHKRHLRRLDLWAVLPSARTARTRKATKTTALAAARRSIDMQSMDLKYRHLAGDRPAFKMAYNGVPRTVADAIGLACLRNEGCTIALRRSIRAISQRLCVQRRREDRVRSVAVEQQVMPIRIASNAHISAPGSLAIRHAVPRPARQPAFQVHDPFATARTIQQTTERATGIRGRYRGPVCTDFGAPHCSLSNSPRAVLRCVAHSAPASALYLPPAIPLDMPCACCRPDPAAGSAPIRSWRHCLAAASALRPLTAVDGVYRLSIHGPFHILPAVDACQICARYAISPFPDST